MQMIFITRTAFPHHCPIYKRIQGVDIVYSDIDLWHEAKGRDAVVKRGFPEGMTNENAFLYQLQRSHLWSGVLFARSSAKLEFDESLSSAVDYDWYFNQYFHGRTIHFIDQSLARYRLHERNTSKKLSKSKGNVERILKKYDFEKAYSRMRSDDDADDLHLAFASVNFTCKFELARETGSSEGGLFGRVLSPVWCMPPWVAMNLQLKCSVHCLSLSRTSNVNNLAVSLSVLIDPSMKLLHFFSWHGRKTRTTLMPGRTNRY